MIWLVLPYAVHDLSLPGSYHPMQLFFVSCFGFGLVWSGNYRTKYEERVEKSRLEERRDTISDF